MLKTVSSITNAIGALNYKGTWNANTNTPDLSTIGAQKGDYYVVSVSGSTSLGGITTWYVGDWAVYNGSAWQRVEGGQDDPAPSLRSNSTTGLLEITGPAASSTRVMTVPNANFTAARTDAAQTFTGDQTFSSKIKTLNGSDTINNGATQTLFTMQTGDVYLVNCSFANFSGGTTTAIVWLPQSGNTSYSGAAILGQNFTTFTLSVSGANVQITNNVSAAVTHYWSAIKLY